MPLDGAEMITALGAGVSALTLWIAGEAGASCVATANVAATNVLRATRAERRRGDSMSGLRDVR